MNVKLMTTSLVLTLATGFAFAQMGVGVNTNLDVRVRAGSSTVSGAVQAESKATIRGNATSTLKKNDNSSSTYSNSSSSSSAPRDTMPKKENQASSTSAEHRSTVANFVQSLLLVADREEGIGAQVRVIARAQNDSASSSVVAITKLESRGKIRNFFFGTDYKSVGQLRSEIEVTQANIKNLQNLLEKTTDVNSKVELQAQIKVLQETEIKLDAFIKAHEVSFSLFGWFNKEK